jgi:hypothetical protein
MQKDNDFKHWKHIEPFSSSFSFLGMVTLGFDTIISFQPDINEHMLIHEIFPKNIEISIHGIRL